MYWKLWKKQKGIPLRAGLPLEQSAVLLPCFVEPRWENLHHRPKKNRIATVGPNAQVATYSWISGKATLGSGKLFAVSGKNEPVSGNESTVTIYLTSIGNYALELCFNNKKTIAEIFDFGMLGRRI